VCPGGTMCEERIGQCVTSEQLDGCRNGSMPNDPCKDGFCRDIDGDGTCADCVCLPAKCGDGYIDGAEQCDGANLGAAPNCTDHAFYDDHPVGCTQDCTYDFQACTRTCGDGVLDSDHGEVCDGAPPAQTCIGFGYDAGYIDCLPGGCSPDFTTCTAFDFAPVASTTDNLLALATGGGHVFAVGMAKDQTGVVFDFDGIRWTRHGSQLTVQLTGAYAASATDVWIIGADPNTGDGHLVHFDGTAFTDMALTNAAGAIWGSSASDIWLFESFTPMHYDGSSWTPVTVPGLMQAQHAWGTGANDLWVSGFGTSGLVLLRYDGTWHDVTPALPVNNPGAGWSFGPDDVYVACSGGVEHWNGVSWTVLPVAGGITGLWGVSPYDLYASTLASVVHYDGARWAYVGLFGMMSLGGNATNVFAVVPTDTAIRRYGGATWIPDFDLVPTPPQIGAAYSPRPDEVFVVLAQRQFTGDIARLHDGQVDTFSVASAIDVGAAGLDVYAVGASYVARWTGTGFTAETAPTTVEGQTSPHFNAVAGPDTSRVFAVGDGIITRDSGGTWSACSVDSQIPTRPLADVWCTSGACVAVGVGGHAYHWSGGAACTWLEEPTPVQSNLVAVWGSSATDVWAGGFSGLLHWNGTAWSQVVVVGLSDEVVSISGTSANDVLAATFTGRVFHFDGTHWAEVHVPQRITYGSLSVTNADVWFAGQPNNSGPAIQRLERTHW